MKMILGRQANTFVMLVAVLCLFHFWKASASQTPIDLLIKDVYIINNKAETSSKTVNVLINKGKIIAISKSAPAAKQTIEGKARYLTPGLIDSHVHLRDIPGYRPTPNTQHNDEDMLAEAEAQIPKSYLYFGFTTLLDLANSREAIAQWNQQEIAPQAYHCIPTTIPNAYPLNWLPPKQQFKSEMASLILYDERQANIYPSTFKPEAHSPTAIVKRIKEFGGSCVKTYYETGFLGMKTLPVPTKKMIRELVKSAHEHQLAVFLHGNSASAHQFAVDTGVDVLAHGLWHTESKPLPELIDKVIDANIRLQPTMQVIYGELELFNPDFFQDQHIAHAMPESLIKWYQSNAGQWMKRNMKMRLGITKDKKNKDEKTQNDYQQVQARYQAAFKSITQSTLHFNDKGGQLLFGSDTPSGPFYTQFPGMNGLKEIYRWHKTGISLEQIFLSLTYENAKLLRKQNEIGSVAVGYEADLLLLDRNPTKNVQAYDEIQWVIVNGQAIPRMQLSALKE